MAQLTCNICNNSPCVCEPGDIAFEPLTEEQRRILKSREERYIKHVNDGTRLLDWVKDDFGLLGVSIKHPEVRAAINRMLHAAGLKMEDRPGPGYDHDSDWPGTRK